MEFWSWVIAVILGLSAIISPIITTIINNRHQLQLKKIELYETSKRKCLENFINAVSNYYTTSNSLGEIINLNTHINNLYIYFDNVPDSVNKLRSLSGTALIDLLTEIVTELSKQIKEK